jgi:hypothetical protein
MAKALSLALVFLALLLLGAGRKFPPLDEQTILSLPEPGCLEYVPRGETEAVQPTYIMQENRGDGWIAHGWSVGILQPTDCLAFALLEEPRFRACCVGAGSDLACTTEAEHEQTRYDCARVFMLGNGRQYPQDQVDDYNAGGWDGRGFGSGGGG